MKASRRILVVLLVVVLLCQTVLAYSDVASGAWYYDCVTALSNQGVINGFEDGSFRPNSTVTTGQFIKMLAYASALPLGEGNGSHWAAPSWDALYDANCLENVSIPCSPAGLDREISRYEMAQLSWNVLSKVLGETSEEVIRPEERITDYASIPVGYLVPVTQVYAKGIITGYEDGSFFGDRILTRAESAMVIYRILNEDARVHGLQVTEPEDPPVEEITDGFVPFAIRYRSMTQAERNLALFGDPNKYYFTAADDVSNFIVNITVPIWQINSRTGAKTGTRITLQVHKLVAEEVTRIFNEIYEDPEQFPILYAGGFRTGDTMRHAWGCAIDINYDQNYYCRVDSSGNVTPLTGSCWEPYTNPYSITPNGSVVRIFKKYGWGWGGQGYSGGTVFDYMHFSILESGG